LIVFAVKLIFVMMCFLGASISDLKTHEVPNELWALMIPVGLMFLVFEVDTVATCLRYGLNISIFIGLGILLFYLGLMGGADAKAIMTLAILFPYTVLRVPFVMILVLFAGLLMMAWYGFGRNPHPFMHALTTAIPIVAFLYVALPAAL